MLRGLPRACSPALASPGTARFGCSLESDGWPRRGLWVRKEQCKPWPAIRTMMPNSRRPPRAPAPSRARYLPAQSDRRLQSRTIGPRPDESGAQKRPGRANLLLYDTGRQRRGRGTTTRPATLPRAPRAAVRALSRKIAEAFSAGAHAVPCREPMDTGAENSHTASLQRHRN